MVGRSLLEILVKDLQYRVCSFDRCVLTLDNEDRSPDALTSGFLVVEVDDILEAGDERHQRKMTWLTNKLCFGKSVQLREEATGTAYAGRRIRQMKDYSFELCMDDYVKNRLRPVPFSGKVWKKDAAATKLKEDEVAQMRGTVASINWAAREGRPDASAAASILAGSFPEPTVQDALEANKVVAKLKSSSIAIKIHSLKEDDIRHVLISDSSFDLSGKTKPQHGWIQGLSTKALNEGREAPVSLISWRSRRMRRKAGSTMLLCESISFSTALGALEKQVATFDSIRLSRYDPRQQLNFNDGPEMTLRGNASVIASENEKVVDPGAVCIVDAKSLYDAAASEQTTGEDDQSALEVAIVQDSLSKVRGRIRWIPHNENPADMLTNLQGAHEEPLMRLLRTHKLRIQNEEAVLSHELAKAEGSAVN